MDLLRSKVLDLSPIELTSLPSTAGPRLLTIDVRRTSMICGRAPGGLTREGQRTDGGLDRGAEGAGALEFPVRPST